MGISHVLRLCLQGGGVYILSGTVTFLSCTVTGNTAYNVHAHAQTSHRPDGKMADKPKSTLIFRFGLKFGSIRDMYVPATPANFPSPRWDFHIFGTCLCLQGGGVAVWAGTVTFSSCTFTGNTASGSVRALVQNFPSPRWNFHMFCACACRGAVCLSAVAQ